MLDTVREMVARLNKRVDAIEAGLRLALVPLE